MGGRRCTFRQMHTCLLLYCLMRQQDFCSCAALCCSEDTCAGLQSGVSEFKNAREAMDSPLAQRLFGIDGVASVFFGSDFVTVGT